MRITRLSLERFRVFEDRLDLPMPAGLVGIYGVNGSGKSTLLDGIRFALYGKARTANDEIRTTGTNGDCVAEVEFEHEGHLYLVRRTLTGSSTAVKAEAHWNRQQVAEGARDVTSYVHSVLGMDDAAFRASVFAEQKQVAAFSGHTAAKRRELVLRLLGITPLDKARDAARADARAARDDHERLVARLPDLEQLESVLAAATEAAEAVAARVAAAESALASAVADAEAAERECDRLDDLQRTYQQLVTDGKAAAAAVADATERLEALAAEAAGLSEARAKLDDLRPLAEGLDAVEQRLRLVEAVAAARSALDGLPVLDDAPPEPDETAVDAAVAAAEAASAEAAALEGEVRGAEAELARAREAAERSAGLAPDEDCPVCGQSLGGALDRVQAHRAEEVAAAEQRATDLAGRVVAARTRSVEASAVVQEARRRLKAATEAWTAWQQVAARRADAEAALAAALAGVEPPPVDGELDALRQDLGRRRAAAAEAARLEGRLDREGAVAEEVRQVEAKRADAAAQREALLEKVHDLGYDGEAHEVQRAARQAARRRREAAAQALEAARVDHARAVEQVRAGQERLDDGRARHAEIADLADRSRHLGRLGELLHDFRNNVVATVGPRLAAQAAELFAELTDREYDALEVDPETYELQIRDAGRTFGMDRFSGSETDLANLALRVAISEQVRFQAGGAVGLLVLDEVFGPLDDDRKERMLLALERLRGRFRQVLVVTHDNEIKEQLPSAIQVVKLPGRRATAEVLTGV